MDKNTLVCCVLLIGSTITSVTSLASSDKLGQLFLEDGSQMPSELHKVTRDDLWVNTADSDEPIKVSTETISRWRAPFQDKKWEREKPFDRVVLHSGQEFLGDVQRFDLSTLILLSPWGQTLEIDREHISFLEVATIELSQAMSYHEWQMDSRDDVKGDVPEEDTFKSGVEPRAGEFFHPNPRRLMLYRGYPGTIENYRIEYELVFPEGVQNYRVNIFSTRRDKGKEPENVSIRYSGDTIRVRALNFTPKQRSIDSLDSKKRPVKHHVVLNCNPEAGTMDLYFNGQKVPPNSHQTTAGQGFYFNHANVHFNLNDKNPVVIKRFGIFPALPDAYFVNPETEMTELLLGNGDILTPDAVSYDGKHFALTLSKNALTIAKERVLRLKFQPTDTDQSKPIFGIALRQNHPVFYADKVTITEAGIVELRIPGLSKAVRIKYADLAHVEWIQANPPAPRNE